MVTVSITGLACTAIAVITVVTIYSGGVQNVFPTTIQPTELPTTIPATSQPTYPTTLPTTVQSTEAPTEPSTEAPTTEPEPESTTIEPETETPTVIYSTLPPIPVYKNELHLYPLTNQFIGYYDSDEIEVEKKFDSLDEGMFGDDSSADFQTIIVLDKSGSMAGQVQRMIQRVFPLFFKKLSYKSTNVIHLITFSDGGILNNLRVDQFPTSPIVSGGTTLMLGAVQKCKEVFKTLDSSKPVRLLTISDGEIFDQPETAAEAAALNTYLRSLNPRFLINSNAIRLFTSTAQPDTQAVSSLLQLNNGPSNSLRDISATARTDEQIAQEMADFFLTDNFDRLRTIASAKPVFKEFPWDSQATSSLKLSIGENVFWVTEPLENGFDDNGDIASPITRPSMNADDFEVLMRIKFDSIIEKIKINQVLGSVESKATVNNIRQYFPDTLQTLPAGRRNVSNMAVFSEIERVASDQSVSSMTPQEKADYLQIKITLPPLEEVY